MENLTLYGALEKVFEELTRKDIVVFEGKEISTKQLREEIEAVSGFLAAVETNKTATVNLPNIPSAITAFYGADRSGFAANMVHPLLPPSALFAAMDKTGSKLLFTFYDYYLQNKKEIDEKDFFVVICRVSDHLPAAKKLAYKAAKERTLPKRDKLWLYTDIIKDNIRGLSDTDKSRSNEDTAVYLHSGGTTGVPKTICLNAKAFNSLSCSLERGIIDNLDPAHNACLSVLPMFHGFGLGVCVHAMLTHGFKIVLMPQFSAKKAVEQIGRHKVNLIAGIPKMFDKIAGAVNEKNGHKLKTLEYCFSGGDKLPERTKKDFDTVLFASGSNAEVQEGYGLTECVTVCCVNKKADYKKNCMGFPLDGIKMDIVDEKNAFLPVGERGEIAVAGKTLMQGYLDSDFEPFFERDGVKWLLTGDFGYKDGDGRFYFEGRKKRLIKISGFNVFPTEIEDVAAELPFVIEAVAIPDTVPTKFVRLFVRTDGSVSDGDAVTLLREHCSRKLIAYSVPREIKTVTEFPRTAVGKIDEKALSEF